METDKDLYEKFLKLLLRSLPFVPGPEMYDLIASVRKSQGDIDQEVEAALKSIQDTSSLVKKLEDGLKDRASKLELLQKEHKKYSQLAEVEAEKAQALISQIKDTLGESAARERYISFAINLVAGFLLFLFGVFAGPWIQSLLGLGGK